MGIWTRQHARHDVSGLTHHSDKGVQYVAIRYTQRLAEAGAVASVGSYVCQSLSTRFRKDWGVPADAVWPLLTIGPSGAFALICRPPGRARSKRCRRIGRDLIGAWSSMSRASP